jgi:endonuclease/exonuclease/phosphatase (EEP) superfamily protein YafD
VFNVQHISEQDSVWTWGTPSSKKLSPRIRLLVWNIWKQSGGDVFAKEFDERTVKADLVVTQEALIDLESVGFFAMDGFETTHAATYRRKDGARDGVLTLSRAKAIKPPIRVISRTTEPILKTTKAALISEFEIEGHSSEHLIVVNIHASLMRRPKTAGQEMHRIIEYIEHHDGPVLVAGDFNTVSHHYMREVEHALESLGIYRVTPEAEPRKQFAQLDQVFARGLRALSCYVDTTAKSSDHFPIICEFDVLND